jgi:hypothetical protein
MVKVKKQTAIKIGVALLVVLIIWCVLRMKRTRPARRVIVTPVPTLAQMKPAETYEDDEDYVPEYSSEDYYDEGEGYAEYTDEPEGFTEYANTNFNGDLLED